MVACDSRALNLLDFQQQRPGRLSPLRRTSVRSGAMQFYLSWVSTLDELLHEVQAAGGQLLTASGRDVHGDFVMITHRCCVHLLYLEVA